MMARNLAKLILVSVATNGSSLVTAKYLKRIRSNHPATNDVDLERQQDSRPINVADTNNEYGVVARPDSTSVAPRWQIPVAFMPALVIISTFIAAIYGAPELCDWTQTSCKVASISIPSIIGGSSLLFASGWSAPGQFNKFISYFTSLHFIQLSAFSLLFGGLVLRNASQPHADYEVMEASKLIYVLSLIALASGVIGAGACVLACKGNNSNNTVQEDASDVPASDVPAPLSSATAPPTAPPAEMNPFALNRPEYLEEIVDTLGHLETSNMLDTDKAKIADLKVLALGLLSSIQQGFQQVFQTRQELSEHP